eukprot:44546-Rhodomonas_salina.2
MQGPVHQKQTKKRGGEARKRKTDNEGPRRAGAVTPWLSLLGCVDQRRCAGSRARRLRACSLSPAPSHRRLSAAPNPCQQHSLSHSHARAGATSRAAVAVHALPSLPPAQPPVPALPSRRPSASASLPAVRATPAWQQLAESVRQRQRRALASRLTTAPRSPWRSRLALHIAAHCSAALRMEAQLFAPASAGRARPARLSTLLLVAAALLARRADASAVRFARFSWGDATRSGDTAKEGGGWTLRAEAALRGRGGMSGRARVRNDAAAAAAACVVPDTSAAAGAA